MGLGACLLLFALVLVPGTGWASMTSDCPVEPTQNTPIVSGQTYFGSNCSISTTGDVDSFQFNASAGDTWSLVAGIGPSHPTNICVTLYAPGDSPMQIFSGCSNVVGDEDSIVNNQTLAVAGLYTVVMSETSNAIVTYALSAERLSPAPPDATPLVLSQNLTGEVATPTAQNAYTFNGCTSGTYQITVSLATDHSHDVCFQVYDSTGTSVAGQKCTEAVGDVDSVKTDLTPAQDGTYLIMVTTAGNDATIAYNLEVSPLLGGCPTSTPTPNQSTPTPTATSTATATATSTATAAPTPTPTATLTATATATLTATATATPTATATAIATMTPTATPTVFRTPTPTATPTATATAPATPTMTPTPNPTPTVVCPTLVESVEGNAAKASKLPVIKPIKFPSQTLGTTSAPMTINIPATAGLMISGVSASSGDFLPTTTCTGQSTPCSITIGYHPSGAGADHATLTIMNNVTNITVALSGSGIAPKVTSLSQRSLPPLQPLTLNGVGFDPDPQASLLVSFTEKTKTTKQPIVLLVPASNKTLDSVQVQVPPIFDPVSKELIPGPATITVKEVLTSGSTLSSKSPSLQIAELNVDNTLPHGDATLAFLQAEKDFATQLEQDVMMNPQLSALGNPLAQAVSALEGLIALLSENPTDANLGSIGGATITESAENLLAADNQILHMLTTMAGGSGSSPAGAAQATGSGCLATEAAAAVADASAGNSANFANDIELLFKDSETSTACQQPSAAMATLGIVNGAGGVALALTAQGANESIQPAVLPATALLLANLAPGGQLLSIGAAIAQTTAQSRQMVQSAVASFNRASMGQLGTLITQTTGPLNSSYNSTDHTEASFVAATPPPLDGTYAGTFTGTQFITGTCQAPINGSLQFSVQGGDITVTIPGAGTGTLDAANGKASFQPTGIGGSNVTCSFGGILLPNQTGPASASGTWSCSSNGIGSSFNSANGTWSATMQ